MPDGQAGGGAAAAVFDGLIQNALGTWGEEKVKPLIVSITETWPPNEHKFISEVAATIFSGNNCPAGQESIKALQAVRNAETLYKVLKQNGHMVP